MSSHCTFSLTLSKTFKPFWYNVVSIQYSRYQQHILTREANQQQPVENYNLMQRFTHTSHIPPLCSVFSYNYSSITEREWLKVKTGKQNVVRGKVSSYQCAWHGMFFHQLHQQDTGGNATWLVMGAKKDLEAEMCLWVCLCTWVVQCVCVCVCLYDCALSVELRQRILAT